jgi:hypothetical protein
MIDKYIDIKEQKDYYPFGKDFGSKVKIYL